MVAIAAATYVVLLTSAVITGNANVMHALAVAPVLVLLTVPLAVYLARRQGDRAIAAIIMAGLLAKLVAAMGRYYVAFVVYNGRADAAQYDNYGQTLAPDFRRAIFDAEVGQFIGTGFIRFFTGVVYAVFGASTLTGFLVFAWISFFGLLLFWRAFQIGVPGGDSRRYLLLVLFVPSLLYWPASIGKEAWMTLALGMCAYGVACLFRHRPHGIVALAAGLFATVLVRPHLGLIVFVGLVFAFIVGKWTARSYLFPIARIVGVGFLILMGVALAGRTATFLGTDNLTQESVDVELGETASQTGEGGSEFTPVRVRTPLDLPIATVTVFVRPFAFEAGNTQGLVSAMEGVLLVVLFAVSHRRLRAIPQQVRSTPYVAFSLGYVIAFVYAFSSFGNFGILARQRVQALPLLLVLLAIPEFQRGGVTTEQRDEKAVPS